MLGQRSLCPHLVPRVSHPGNEVAYVQHFANLSQYPTLLILAPASSNGFIEASSKLHQREIWKHSFISTARPTVHTNPSRKRSFSKTLFKPKEFKTVALRLTVDEKKIGKRDFRKRRGLDNGVIYPHPQSCTQAFLSLVTVAFTNSSGEVRKKAFDMFSEWTFRLQISPV